MTCFPNLLNLQFKLCICFTFLVVAIVFYPITFCDKMEAQSYFNLDIFKWRCQS